MKKRQTLFIRLPQGSENIRIVKEIKLDDKNSIQFTLDDTFEETDTADRYDSKVFLCYQDRTRTRFNPYAYSYIEAVGGHNFRWMPADNKNPSIVMSIKSLDNLLSQLHKYGLKNFLKVHASYAVNTDHIRDYKDGYIIVRGGKGRVPVSDRYKKHVDKNILIISYDGSK